MSATTILDEPASPFAPQGLTDDERHRIESDIRSLRAGIADMDTAVATEQGAFRQWCYEVREQMRREVALLWSQLGEATAATSGD